MKVSYWLRQYQREDTTPLYFHSDEQMLTVLNGSVQVTLVSSLYSEKLPDDENQLFLISRSKEGIEIISFFVYSIQANALRKIKGSQVL